MIKKIFQALLLKSGKKYTIDNDIPDRLFLYFMKERLIMIIRGYFIFRKKVFVGENTNILNRLNIEIGQNVTIEDYVKIDGFAKNKLRLGNNSKIGKYSIITCTSHMSKYGKGFEIGDNSSCGQFCEFGSAGGVSIGNDVIMGGYVSFHSENHNFINKNKLIREQGVTSKGIKIGNNIWVGAKVTFLDGSKIGDNCVIAAGAVVTKEFPNNVIIGGIPAKIIKEIM
ncbi:acyltransferase [Empedobacter brevis]|uniref:acyltransferase n=1 Tax=Empedobacter brevis TaxID=247 RepID=UPI0039B01CD9